MKVRKIVAGLAAMSMMAAFSAQAVFAAGVSIKAGTATAAAGEKATVAVSLEGVTAPINAVEFQVTYDASVLTLNGVTPGDAVPASTTDGAENFEGVSSYDVTIEAGSAVVSYSTGLSDTAYCVNADGVIANLDFTVAAGAAAGTYEVSIVPVNRPVYEGTDTINNELTAAYIKADGTVDVYGVTATAGAVEVTGGTVTPPVGTTTYGDVDCNGTVDIADVLLLNQNLLGIADIGNPQGKVNADVDNNGSMNDTDALNILKSLVDLVTLPVA